MPLFSRTLVTLDFEDGSLRWLTTKGNRVLRWNRVRLVAPSSPDGQEGPEAIGEQLAGVFKTEALPKKPVVVSVGGQRAIFRTLTLPEMDRSLLGAAVQRKLRQEIPLQPQEIDLSWEIIGRSEGELSIYIAAIPREEIDRQMTILRAAGIRPAAMDVKSLALIRTANRSRAVIVSLEDSLLTIVVVVDGTPQIIRTVPLGASTASAEGRLDLVLQELVRTTKFYNESHKAHPLPADCPLFLTGSNFRSPAMVERISPRSPYPVAELDPPLSYPDGLSLADFGVNIGLALKAL